MTKYNYYSTKNIALGTVFRLEVHMYLLNFVHVVLHGTLDFLMISENYYNSFHFSFLSEVLHKALYASFPKPTSHYLPDHHMEYSRTDSLLTLIHLVDQIYKLQTINEQVRDFA